jgi:hypothetical protein
MDRVLDKKDEWLSRDLKECHAKGATPANLLRARSRYRNAVGKDLGVVAEGHHSRKRCANWEHCGSRPIDRSDMSIAKADEGFTVER